MSRGGRGLQYLDWLQDLMYTDIILNVMAQIFLTSMSLLISPLLHWDSVAIIES